MRRWVLAALLGLVWGCGDDGDARRGADVAADPTDTASDAMAGLDPDGARALDAGGEIVEAGVDLDRPDAPPPADCFAPRQPARWTVCGGQIHDPEGRRVLLRGVNVSQDRKLTPYSGGTDPEDIAAMRALGLNHVRLLWSWAAAMPARGELDGDYLSDLADEVRRLSEAGILVVMDAHQDLYGEAIRTDARTVGNGAPAWSCPESIAGQFETPLEPWFANYGQPAVRGCFDHLLADTETQDLFARAWGAVAGRVADFDNVVGYDLWNEPFWGSHNISTWEVEYLLPLYERLGAAIEVADPAAVLFVEPGAQKNVFGTSNLAAPDFEHIVYAPHLYDVAMESGERWSGSIDALERRLGNDRQEAATLGAALYVGEWGTPGSYDNDPDYVAAVTELLDDDGLSWAIWQWGPGGPGSYALSDGDRAFNPHAAALARPYVARLAGASLEVAWDPGEPRATITFTARDASTPTIVELPSLVFGEAPRVEITGGAVVDWVGGRLRVRADAAGGSVEVRVTAD